MDGNKSKAGGQHPGDGGPASDMMEEHDALLAKLNRAQAIAHIGDWEWEIATNDVSWSEELYRIYGFEPGEVLPNYGLVLSQMHPSSKEEFLKAIDAALNEDRPFEMDYRFLRKDGTEACLHTIGEVARDQDGTPLRMHGIVQDMTGQTLAEEQLKESEEKFRTIFEQAMDGMLIADVETGMFVEANGTICSMLGYSREEILGLGIKNIHREEDHPEMMSTIDRQQRGEIVLAPERPVLRKDGSIFLADISASVMTLGGRSCLVGTFHDVSERRKAEEKLSLSEGRLRESQEVAKIGSWSWDVVNGTLEWSDETCRRFDKDPATFTPTVEYYVGLIHPDDREGIEKAIAASLAHDAPYHIQPRIRNESGREWVLEGFGRVERDGEGKPIRFAGTAQDITERKRIEQALRDSESLYRNLVETTAAIAWEVDIASLRFTYISPQVEEITGYPPEAWDGFAFWAERIHPDDRERAVTFCQTETGKGLDHTFEYRMSAADGSTLWIRDVVSVIKDQGRPVTLRGYFIDITTSKEAEEKLRESEEFVRRILDTMDAGVISIDRDYRIKSANVAFCSQVGRSASEVIGKHCYEITHGSFRPCYEEGEDCAVRRVFEDGETHAALHHHTDSEGSRLYVETKAFPVRDSSGNVVSAVEMIVNITERHLLEEERLKAQKLESIGTLAGGIAHDFNNLLQGVFGHISMARMSIERQEESIPLLEQAEKALHQAVSLTNQLLTFAKGGKPVKEHVPILPVVESAARFALSGSSCDCEILPQDDLWQVDGDAGQIGQVLQNIVLNADQSMPQGGRIEIMVDNVPPDRERPAVLGEGDFVLITVRDNGPGIPEKSRERLFDPYFTTREGGTGLGLATSYSIIKNHGGIIDVESEPGEGAVFAVYLPAIRQKPVETAAAAPVETRSAKVLIMDDDEMIRKISGKILRSLGHECEFAEKGESTVAMFKAARDEGRPFDLVILDLTIRGGMGGADTIGELLAIDPEVKAIVSTGYSDDGALPDYRSQGFELFLKKPYTVEELRDAINSLLG